MPETKSRGRTELVEFVAAIVIAAVVLTVVYLVADDRLPILLGVALVGGLAFVLAALVSVGIVRQEARR